MEAVSTVLIGLSVGLFLFLISVISKSVYLVQQAQAVVLERLGIYSRTMGPGLHFIVPFLDRPRSFVWTFLVSDARGHYNRIRRYLDRVDLREAVYDFPKQHVITRDNVTIEINALLYYQITDPKAAIYEVANLPEAIEKLTQTTLRNVIGSLDLDETLVSRDQINQKLRIILDDATDKWGVKVNRVELQEVTPPPDVRNAMEKQMRAEREKRALILESEGKKRSAILEAEGAQQSAVLKAKGGAEAVILAAEAEATARCKTAEAEAKALSLLNAQISGKDAVGYLLATNYIKALPQMMNGKNDKLVVVPYEASSLIGLVASVKEMLPQVFKGAQK